MTPEVINVFGWLGSAAVVCQPQLAHELLTAAADGRNLHGEKIGRGKLRTQIGLDICHARMWRAVMYFGNLKKSGEELLEEFQFLAKTFPNSEHHRARSRPRSCSNR